MNIGWIFFICAFIILMFIAVAPWHRKERARGSVEEIIQVEECPLDEQVKRLLLQRKKIQAIKLYRVRTGVGLREAKAAVEALEGDLQLGRAEEITKAEEGSLDDEVKRLLLQRKKLQAIKLYRTRTGLGLREAKEAVDYLERSLRRDMRYPQ